MYKLQYTRTFEKQLKKLTLSEQRAVAQKLKLLCIDPLSVTSHKENSMVK